MKIVLACLLAITLTSGCRDRETEGGTYRSSEGVRVKILTYQPRRRYSTGMASGVISARVETIRNGAPPYEVPLPASCPEEPIRAALGRDVIMRQDVFVRADGSTYTIVTNDEMVAALCGDLESRMAPPPPANLDMSSSPLPM